MADDKTTSAQVLANLGGGVVAEAAESGAGAVGTSTAVTSTAGVSTAGVSTAGVSTAGTSAAGTSTVEAGTVEAGAAGTGTVEAGTAEAGAAGTGAAGAQAGAGQQDPPRPVDTPVPEVSIDLKRDHPELYAAYVKHVQTGYESNDRIFAQVLSAFLRSHYSSLVMYWILFSVGVILFVVAVGLALFQNQAAAGAVFAGLSVVSFLLYFVSRPTQAVEENLIYIAWLGVVYNSYWTHLAWATERGTAQSQLDKATSDVVQQLNALLDRHAQSVKERPSFKETLVG